ncbi:SAM-dependent methyltransferase [Saccharopolyspora spinosa]|uniref:SAM-dependent methyltransferase n=1 Tax=Saccharopolyspora spinosa TaxID=60894 RepID=UPI0002E398C5|nr:SAM-dependent methyltransferase [Saccharopolyspora spinosa]
MPDHAQLPQDLAPDRPSGARVYDYFLGGSCNFASDRELARRLLSVAPDVRLNALANRACLHRVIRICLATGVRQLLDVGCGLPAIGTPHEVAQQLVPRARGLRCNSTIASRIVDARPARAWSTSTATRSS